MTELKYCEFFRLDWNDARDKDILRHWIKTCDDNLFDLRCTSLLPRSDPEDQWEAPDTVYLAVDMKKNMVVGGMNTTYYRNKQGVVDCVWLGSITSMAKKYPKEYRGVGGKLMEMLVRDCKVNNIDFIWISSPDPDAVPFYIKMGFLFLANTYSLVMPIRKVPDINRVRWLYINFMHPQPRVEDKFQYTKRMDDMDRWFQTYGIGPQKYREDYIVPLIKKQNTIIYPMEELKKIKLYPDKYYLTEKEYEELHPQYYEEDEYEEDEYED